MIICCIGCLETLATDRLDVTDTLVMLDDFARFTLIINTKATVGFDEILSF